jgi:predicted amidophosphoribosyltransferase
MEPTTCPQCHFQIQSTFYFCPNCGKNLKPAPLSTSIGRQIGIYAVSIFLPPLGIVPGMKYLLQKDSNAKLVGIIAILLTILSSGITVWYTIQFINQINTQVNSQLNNYQNIGF